jgi:hypothetical protein
MRWLLSTVVTLGVGIVAGYGVAHGQGDLRPFQDGRSTCVPYDPDRLVIEETGSEAWQLRRADGAIFRVFINREDAEAGLAVARQHNQLC